LATRLFRRFEDGELDALRASGDGLPGGPPTTKPAGAGATFRFRLLMASCRPAVLEARELRRSFGGGMGEGDDMWAGGGRGEGQGRLGLSRSRRTTRAVERGMDASLSQAARSSCGRCRGTGLVWGCLCRAGREKHQWHALPAELAWQAEARS
jgi:hypothetical protein